jgi:hypothetical protein
VAAGQHQEAGERAGRETRAERVVAEQRHRSPVRRSVDTGEDAYPGGYG